MPREYRKVKHLEEEIFAEKAAGRTNREIGAEYGLSKRQVECLINRHNRRKRKEAAGIIPQRRRKAPDELEQLRMENELLRDFVKFIGRR